MVTLAGPLATINCESSQARKGAAAAMDSGAGVWLVRGAACLFPILLLSKLIYFGQLVIIIGSDFFVLVVDEL